MQSTVGIQYFRNFADSDKYLVSAEIVAYLKWLIYIAAFKERGNLGH